MNDTDRLMEALDSYYEIFEDHFPTMCFQTDTDDELIKRINHCIKEKRTAEDIYHLDYKNDY